MKKRVLLYIFLIMIFMQNSFAETIVYSENDKFGLKESNGNIITKADYKKLVVLGNSSWIMQDGTKFGIIANNGEIIVEAKFNQAERVLGRFVKFRKGDKYGIFDELGFEILPVEYSSIDLLYGGMFVTCKNFKYGISDFNGNLILDNIFDDVYMPEFNKLVLVYHNQVIELERPKEIAMNEPFDITSIYEDLDSIYANDFEYSNPISATSYYGVTFTDYILKLFSSISPAYEQTIDEIMYSQGADTVNILMKLSWIPKFPFVYAKKYYKTLINPNNGPLNTVKKNLKTY